MRILVNCSNLNRGGGLQVAHSFLDFIKNSSEHFFLVVLTDELEFQLDFNEFNNRFQFFNYRISFRLNLFNGHEDFLDKLVKDNNISIVFSIFGPTYWRPKVKHVVGYAKPQYIYIDSPFFSIISLKAKLSLLLKRIIHLNDFRINSDIIVTENDDVSKKLSNLIFNKPIFTVTNYYNQIFDSPSKWDRSLVLEKFEGITFLTVSSNYPHKNLKIISEVIKVLKDDHPYFNFRFVLTIEKFEFLSYSRDLDPFIVFLGKVNIKQVPFLYSQADFIFLPTLLECFTASFPEAMKMRKPILTSNLDFARGLCGDAAIYFDPLDPKDIVNKIFLLVTNESLKFNLINKGVNRLSSFDNYSSRVIKYFDILLNETNYSRS